MLTKNIIAVLLMSVSMTLFCPNVKAEPDADVFLTGFVDEFYSINVIETSAQLPGTNSATNYKISDFILSSNMPNVTLSYGCASSPNDNNSCDLIKTGSNSINDRIRYAISFDQSQFSGVTSHTGEIRISYSVPNGRLAGTYSDTITITIDPQ